MGTRGQYEDVVAAKDETIAFLKEQYAALAVRLEAPINVSVSLPEGFAVQMPAVVGTRPKRQQDQDTQRPAAGVKEPDWANVDPNDNEAIARIAAQELGKSCPGSCPRANSPADQDEHQDRQSRQTAEVAH